MIVTPIRTRVFREEEDLLAFIAEHVPDVPDGAVLAVTSKIVALAEGRTAPLSEKEKVIREESEYAHKTKHVWLTVKDGGVIANAGVDESNADGRLILLPRDSFSSAGLIRRDVMRRYGVRRLGVVVTDSRVAPLRAGITGVALGYAGVRGVRDYRGTKDMFGRPFKYASANVADMLASAAVLVMGEGAERQPLALIEGAPVEFASRIERGEARVSFEDDMYRPFFESAAQKKFEKKRKTREKKPRA